MNKRNISINLISLILMICPIFVVGQTSKQEIFDNIEKTGGVYYIYPSQEIVPHTAAPKGYKPFYISHFSRHGSRYLINDNDYKWVIDLFEDASKNNALTTLGTDVYKRLQEVWKEAEWKGGDLSPLGVRQHKGIAERMFKTYPEVFEKNAPVFASSTMVIRCALSMDAFCESLKELNPALQTTRESSMEHQRYLNHHTKEAIAFRSAKDTWKEEHRKFEESRMHPERLVNSLFSNKDFITKKVNPSMLMWGLYWIASDMQNMETDLSFYDIFEKQELFDLWESHNFKLYANDSNWAGNGDLMFENCKPVLKDILDKANDAIKTNTKGATLRFAHDGNIIPLTMLMHLDGCYNSVQDPAEVYKSWSDFKVAPMAGNIQMIFFRNQKNADDVLVKFLLHEKEVAVPPIKTDIAPYYHWADVEAYYNSLLNK